jgi:phosphoglucomutase
MSLQEEIEKRLNAWKGEGYDQETKEQIKSLEASPDELADAFYKDLEFGTGGLRGLMGVGPNRMNRYTVGAATQGLANYLLKQGGDNSVAIAFDSRNKSDYFAQVVADVLSANGITVYKYPELRPTPLLSYTVRQLKCTAGIVITASHNPKEYNGYKVYWNDGGQLVPPHDKGIIAEVRKVSDPSMVKKEAKPSLIHEVPASVEEAYYQMLDGLLQLPKDYPGKKSLRILYTSLHGTGITMIPQALKDAGFDQVHILDSQAEADGNFPTVKSPNPEERSAMTMAIAEADKVKADVILGTDPDTDRVGMGIRNAKGEIELLNGNQAAALMIYFILNAMKAKGQSFEDRFIAKTIVTSELLKEIADREGVTCYDTLTGFKYIAELIKEKEGKERFIAGGEESYGYLVGDEVRDKDAVLSTVMLCEMAAWSIEKAGSVRKMLFQLYNEVAMYRESLISITKKGISGAQEIQDIMTAYREETPESIADIKVLETADYKAGTRKNIHSGENKAIPLPNSNVFQIWLEDGTKITARPSGTEPKIKYYISVRSEDKSMSSEERWEALGQRISKIEKALGL